MNIDWVIPCRYVEVHDNLGTIVGAGIDTYWLPTLPAPVQVIMAVRLLAMAEELESDEPHHAINRVRDPHGQVMSEISGDFAFTGRTIRPEWLTGLMLATAVQFEATEDGAYTIEHVVDGATASVPIHIVHGLPPGMVPPTE
jgi:hypothetical protein